MEPLVLLPLMEALMLTTFVITLVITISLVTSPTDNTFQDLACDFRTSVMFMIPFGLCTHDKCSKG